MPPCFLAVMRGLPFFLALCALGQTAVVVDVGVIGGSDFSAVPGYVVLAVWNDSVREADPPPAVSLTPPPAVSPTPPPGGTPPPVGPPGPTLPLWAILVLGLVCVGGLVGIVVGCMRHRAAVVHGAQAPPPHSIKVKMAPIRRNN